MAEKELLMSEERKSRQASATPDVRAIVAQSTPADYDGHTEFERMTPAQRLTWLDQAVLFIVAQKQRNETLQVAEEPKNSYKAK